VTIEDRVAAFLKGCPSAARLFEKDIARGLEAALDAEAIDRAEQAVIAQLGPVLGPRVIAASLARGATMIALKGSGRSAHLVEARREVATILDAAGFSTVDIGRFLNRDHSTIIQAYLRPLERRYAVATGEAA